MKRMASYWPLWWAMLVVGVVWLLLMQLPIDAQQAIQQSADLRPGSHATVSVSNQAVVALSSVSNQGASGGALLTPGGTGTVRYCHLTVETANVRYWEDGTAPTTTVGTLLTSGSVYTLQNATVLANWQAIGTSSTAAQLDISCAQ